MQKLVFGLVLLFPLMQATAQKRKLSPVVSHWSNNEYAPKLTADGRTMVYMSDNPDTGQPEILISHAKGSNNWTQGKAIDIPNKDLIPFGAFNISYDGKQLIYATRKGPNIGGYDIRFQERQGDGWGDAVNPGKPLNSPLHEMDPTLSADGKTMYYSRCETLDPSTGNCKLLAAEYLGKGYWKAPKEIDLEMSSSSFVNPVILPDNRTLYFSALNSNGDYDFYMTRKQGSAWSKPVAMDFLNTNLHDRYLGVTALGDVLYTHEKDDRSYDLYMVKVPEKFQPSKVYYIEGTVTNLPAKALVKATDLESGEELARVILDPEENSFGVYLPEGHQVDFYIETKEKGYGYYSEYLDLQELATSKKVIKDINLPSLQVGKQYPMSIDFVENSINFEIGAEEELNRLMTLMKQNRTFHFNLKVFQESVEESEQYGERLTEIRYDTISTHTETVIPSSEDKEAGGNIEGVLTIYHNDLTQKRADAIKAYLLEKGVPDSMFSATGDGENSDMNYLESGKTLNSKVVFSLE